MSEQSGPATATGRLFQALGRGDMAQIRHWQQVLQDDAVGQEELPVMTEYVLAELVAAGPRTLRARDIARIYRRLKDRGLSVRLSEVQCVLDAASGKTTDLGELTTSQRIKISVAAYPVVAADFGISDPELTASVLKAEQRLKDSIK